MTIMTQKRINMRAVLGFSTPSTPHSSPLSMGLRALWATLILLFFPIGAWGQTQPTTGNGTDSDPYVIMSTENLVWVFQNNCSAKLGADLIGNLYYQFTVSNNSTVKLDLDGHSIRNTYTFSVYNSPIIIVNSGCNLTILDSSDGQTGTISGARTSYNGSSPNHGGGICNKGTLTIQGGTISDNDASNGDGIYNAPDAVLNIMGGTISGNDGEGIRNEGTLTISGGIIRNNSSYGIYNAGTFLTISGNPQVYGNSNGAYNIYLPTGKTIIIGGNLTCADASIGVRMQSPGIFTTGSTSETNYQKFISDDIDYEVVKSETDYNVALKSCWSLLDKQIAEATSGNTITLTKDYRAVATDTYLTVPNSQNITLELNGHTLNRNTSAKADGCVIRNLGTLTIQDTSVGSTGIIKGGNNTNGGGGIHNEGTLTIKSGKIQSNTSSYSGAGIYNAGTLTVDGGFIQSNTTTKLGAGIYNESGKSVTITGGTIQTNSNSGDHGGGVYNKGILTINGGTISGNSLSAVSKHGAGIYNAGSLTITGGTIQNNTLTQSSGLGAGIYHNGTAFNLQGAPTISNNKYSTTPKNVYLATGKKITITGDLTNATAIGVNMETLGEFTTELSFHTGTYTNFTSEAANTVRLTDYNADYSHTEAELITYWSYLNRQFSDPSLSDITLDAGSYVANNSIESYLYVPSTKTITLSLNSQTLNRNISQSNGYARENGCVLFNEGNLTITGTGNIQGGHNSGTGTTQGGGIYNTGTLILSGGTISSNRTSLKGGGIYNNGTLTINGGIVQGNTSSGVGRGIYNAAGKAMTFSSGSIRNNTGGVEHGGGIYNDGTLDITGGTISGNTIDIAEKNGAGVYNNGTMTISGETSIQSNWTKGNGGAIYNAGTLTVSGGSITDNGIYVNGNTNEVRTVNGGGIFNAGTLTISGGSIQTNKATTNGAGIYNGGATFNLSGAPTISNNYVGNQQHNIYLPAAHPTITITAALSNATPIGIRMETPDVFTSGLSGKGTIDKFVSNNSGTHKLVETGGEAALMTHWNYLQRRFNNATENEVISLESGCSYVAGSNDTYLHVPSSKKFTLNLNGNTINRNITQNVDSKKDNGCVIYNQGTLTITGSGTIQGGNNSDVTDIKGGGICNAGTLTLESGAIRWNMAATSGGGIYHTGEALNIQGGTIQTNIVISGNGGGIYHNGTTFNLQGAPYLSGNTANGTANNVYLCSGKTITITGKLTNTTAIGITSQDDHPKFTSGLHGWDDDANKLGDASKFAADQTETHGIGLASDGEAIVGLKYNVTRTGVGDSYIYIHVKNVNANTTAVEGELVKVKIYGNGSSTIPISLSWTGGVLSPYPDAGVEYEFVMPANDVNITGECRYGGYCGNPTEVDMKYYLKDGTLKFVTRSGNNYAMKNYATKEEVPWRGYSYSAVDISKVTSISDYAFYGSGLASASVSADVTSIGTFAFGKCASLTEIVVDGSNAYYSSSEGVLYNKAKTELICYPVGKDNLNYTLPSTVTTITPGAFAYGSHLQTIAVAGGSSFKSVDGVLYNYAGTTLVYYPAGNTSVFYEVPTTATIIDPYAFHNAHTLTHVFLTHGSLPTGNATMFDESTFYIMVPSTLKSTYEGTDPWDDYATRYRNIELTNDNATTVVLEYLTIDCDGTPKTPTVISVKKDNRTLIFDTDYTVSYSDNTEVGTATVTITGQGIYSGSTVTRTFTITRRVDISGITGQYATYYAAEDLVLPSSIWDSYYYEWCSFKAYTISDINWTNNTITISEIIPSGNGYIPKDKPILIYNKAFDKHPNQTFHLTKYTGTQTSVTPSTDFIGVSASTTYETIKAGKADIYVLRGNFFVRATGGTLTANRCYITRPSSPYPAPVRLSFGEDDETTGITEQNVIGSQNMELFSPDWYTLEGVKLDRMPTQKGIYINNGRKIIIK